MPSEEVAALAGTEMDHMPLTHTHSGARPSGGALQEAGVSRVGGAPPRCSGCFSLGLLPTSIPFPQTLLSDKNVFVLFSVPGPAWLPAWS